MPAAKRPRQPKKEKGKEGRRPEMMLDSFNFSKLGGGEGGGDRNEQYLGADGKTESCRKKKQHVKEKG